MTDRTGLAEQDWQTRTGRIGLSGQDCQDITYSKDRAARTGQQERTASRGQPAEDSQNRAPNGNGSTDLQLYTSTKLKIVNC